MAVYPIEEIFQKVSGFAKDIIRQHSSYYDQAESFPQETIDQLSQMDIFRIPFPKEYGGMGGSIEDYLKVIQTISENCAATGSIVLTQTSFGTWPIYEFGSQEQKEKYLPRLLNGEVLGALAMSERESGTAIERMQTVAVEHDDYWELNGEKAFVSNATKAGIYLVAAKVQYKNGEEAYGIFILKPDMKGFSIGPLEEKMGMRALPVAPLKFDQVKVPKENILSGKEQTYTHLNTILDRHKLFIAAQAIGIANASLDRALEYVGLERQFGQRLIDLPNTQFRLAEIYMEVTAAKALLQEVIRTYPKDQIKIATAKLKASTVAVQASEVAIQVTGGYGYMRNNDIERYVRDAKLTAIYGGSSDTQKKLISHPWL